MQGPFSHCGWCGAVWGSQEEWPRDCATCGHRSYRNPLPVSVVLLPVEGGLLIVKRSIEPQKGTWCLPGGFINWGETWQQAGAREVQEETGITIEPDELEPFWFASAPEGMLLVFSIAPTLKLMPEAWTPTEEAESIDILDTPQPLGFPLHTAAAQRWFDTRRAYIDRMSDNDMLGIN